MRINIVAKPIIQYTLETDVLCGRGFTLVEETLQSGFKYDGFVLYDTQASAQAELDEDIKDGMIEEDEISVIEVVVHADGSIFDSFGQELASHMAMQNNQTIEQVKAGLAQYYTEAERRLRHAAEAVSEGPDI
jgi:hypothetical protein